MEKNNSREHFCTYENTLGLSSTGARSFIANWITVWFKIDTWGGLIQKWKCGRGITSYNASIQLLVGGKARMMKANLIGGSATLFVAWNGSEWMGDMGEPGNPWAGAGKCRSRLIGWCWRRWDVWGRWWAKRRWAERSRGRAGSRSRSDNHW